MISASIIANRQSEAFSDSESFIIFSHFSVMGFLAGSASKEDNFMFSGYNFAFISRQTASDFLLNTKVPIAATPARTKPRALKNWVFDLKNSKMPKNLKP